MIAIVAAVLFTAALTAPISVLAWDRRRRVRAYVRYFLHRRPRSRTLPRLSVHLVRSGAHATPPGGTPIPTSDQIQEAAA